MKLQNMGLRFSLVILAVFFFLGAVGGNVIALFVSQPEELVSYFGEFQASAQSGTMQMSFANTIFTNFLLPVLIFSMGFSSLGIVIVPLCLAFKGFTLSFAISGLLRVFGTGGTPMAIGALGIQNLFYLPCLFLIAFFAFRSSAVMASVFLGKNPKPAVVTYGSLYFVQFAICSIVILGLASFETFLQPQILSWITALV